MLVDAGMGHLELLRVCETSNLTNFSFLTAYFFVVDLFLLDLVFLEAFGVLRFDSAFGGRSTLPLTLSSTLSRVGNELARTSAHRDRFAESADDSLSGVMGVEAIVATPSGRIVGSSMWTTSSALSRSFERDDLSERMVRDSRFSPMPRRLAKAVHELAFSIYMCSACAHIKGKCSSTHKRYEEPCTSKREVVG